MLVSTEPGGLGNRIKSWVTATRIDPGARVFWPQTPNMPAAFGGLFTNPVAVDEVPAGAVEHCSWQLAVLPEDHPQLAPGFAEVVSNSWPLARRIRRFAAGIAGRPDERFRYLVMPKRFSRRNAGPDGRVIDFEYGRIPEYFRELYRPLFAAVSVQPAIIERVDSWVRQHPDTDFTGVQVRTWRDSPRRHRRHYRPAVKRLLALLAAAPASERFFVVSDDDSVVPWLREQLGAERVLAYARDTARNRSWETKTGMIEDLIDMLLLARSRTLFASYLSTFSETAWWLGGARAEVSVF